jgi:hypothetical protein
LQLDTHKVAILVTIIKTIVHLGLVDPQATIAAIEAQMDDQVTV